MHKKIITCFFDEKAKLNFYDASAYISMGKALLYNKNGHMLLTECSFVEQLIKQQIPSELLRPLTSRGFAGTSEFLSFTCDNQCEVKPEFFMVDLTNKCNMRCKYCLRNVSAPDETVSEEKLYKICKYIEAYCDKENLAHVSIQPWGGEPLLELDFILKMRQWIHPKRTKVHFFY